MRCLYLLLVFVLTVSAWSSYAHAVVLGGAGSSQIVSEGGIHHVVETGGFFGGIKDKFSSWGGRKEREREAAAVLERFEAERQKVEAMSPDERAQHEAQEKEKAEQRLKSTEGERICQSRKEDCDKGGEGSLACAAYQKYCL